MRIFLCHGTEDKNRIRELYADLKREGHQVWLDEESLHPGVEWDSAIRAAIRDSHVVLVCLSNRSVNKTGYIQKEIRAALDRADEMPEGAIYIIPVRLEECPVPLRLEKLHSVDIFTPVGFERLQKFLKELALHLDGPALDLSRPLQDLIVAVPQAESSRVRNQLEKSHDQPPSHSKLATREHELLDAATHQWPRKITHSSTSAGDNLTAGRKAFLRDADPETRTPWIAALENLELLGLIRANASAKGSYSVTEAGKRVSAILGRFQRWETAEVTLSTHFRREKPDSATIFCRGVVKVPSFYHSENIEIDGTLTRRFKWDEALWVEGVDLTAVRTLRWEPQQVSFVDPLTRKTVEFPVHPLAPLEAHTLLLEIRKAVPSSRIGQSRKPDASHARADLHSSTGPHHTAEKPKVLVVDGERVIADTLAMILNQSGFEARTAHSAKEAFDAVPNFEPKILIAGVALADVNGIDMAIQIRGMLPNIKILLFAGQAGTLDLLEKAREQGHEFEILAKPVHPQDLLQRLRSQES